MSCESVVRNSELVQRFREGTGLISPLKVIQFFSETWLYMSLHIWLLQITVYTDRLQVYLFFCRWQQCSVGLINWL